MARTGRPRKNEAKKTHFSTNLEPDLYAEIEQEAIADNRTPSAFGRLLLTAAWRTYKTKGNNGSSWLSELGRWTPAASSEAHAHARRVSRG